MGNSDQLIAALCDPNVYDHETSNILVIETHISWVLLTGQYAYKIKKPVKFSFVDFSTLEKRQFYCYEELRLNTRLAPDLYLDVVVISGTSEKPKVNNSKNPIEYAVKMHQFSQKALLSYLSDHGQLMLQHIDNIALEIAEFHQCIEKVALDSSLGQPKDIHHWVIDNFMQINSKLETKNFHTDLNQIQTWSEEIFEKKKSQFQSRKMNGFIRECHGDMHLGNIVLLNNKVCIFDGIDFNEHLRWIDVMSEVAFVSMDLQNRKHPRFANHLINLYLENTGDYEGLGVFNYYFIYRAMVRAKVAMLRIAQKHLAKEQEIDVQQEFNSYIELALAHIADKKKVLIITHGLSGSGKSTHTESLLAPLEAIRIRSDVERKRLHGYTAAIKTQSRINEGIYSEASSYSTYSALKEYAESILDSGYSVIVDACFLQKQQRDVFHALARVKNVPFIILKFHANEDTLKKRIVKRAKKTLEPSEADIEVLSSQIDNYVPLAVEEEMNIININTEEEIQSEIIVNAIVKRM